MQLSKRKFWWQNKLNNLLNEPSCKYIEIIKDGLKDLDYSLTEKEMNEYLKNSIDFIIE